MAVIENVATVDGDILQIQTEVPIVGLLSLSQFVDTTTGESITDYFRKEFRYSVDGGLTFSSWTELTLLNIQSVAITRYDAFVLQYRYTRVGSTPAVTLSFNDILVSGVVTDLPYPLYERTVFNKFFVVNDLNVFGWALNVLEKLYAKGLILPDYMTRGLNQSNLEDEDFIAFWNSTTHLFAILVYFARQFHDFESNQILLEQFLRSRDLTLPLDGNILDILYLYQNYINEYRKRGTLAIIDQNENGASIDGELVRLVDHQIYEELVFALFQNYESGWCLDKSSPLWKGTEKIVNIIKGYEYTSEVVDLTKYPLVNDTYISIVSSKMQIDSVPNATESGINGSTKKISVDPSQDYEISFRVSQSIKETNLIFGCRVWDKDGNELIFKNVNLETDTNYFFYQKQLNLVDTDYWVRGILFNSSTPTLIGSKTTLDEGNNLRIPATGAYIVPIIEVLGTGSANVVKIDNIKIRPRKLNFSRGQLGIHNLIYLLTKNNNGSLTTEKIDNFIKEKLIPYNSFLKTNIL